MAPATRLEQLADCLPHLPALLHWVADGYYAKKEVFTLFIRHRRHLITRLRHDAALYHLWTKGRQPGQRGPTRLYDGKAVFDDLSRWQHEGTHPIHDHIELYSALLYRTGGPVEAFRAEAARGVATGYSPSKICLTGFDRRATIGQSNRPLLPPPLSDRITLPGCQAVHRLESMSGSQRC